MIKKNLKRFLSEEWLGETLAPAIHDQWPSYEQTTGVDPKHVHEYTPDYENTMTTYWFKTKHPNLYLLEIRSKERLWAKYFCYYNKKEWPPKDS